MSVEEERLALLAKFRDQRKTLVEQIAEAAKFLAETDLQIAKLEQDWGGLFRGPLFDPAAPVLSRSGSAIRDRQLLL